VGLNLRVDGRIRSDGTGDFAGSDFGAGIFQPFFGAFEGGVMAGEFKSKGRRFSVNAVRTAYAERIFMFFSPLSQSSEKFVQVLQQQVSRLSQLYRESGIDDVTAGHTLVNKAGVLADMLGDISQE